MMILAEVSSGRSDFDNSSPTKPDRPGSAAAATASIGADEAPGPVAWNVAVRTVITRFFSVERTVWMALPA
jgi:hypothetical protein